MRVERVTLICDLCQTERDNAGVELHRLGFDGGTVALDACRKCWGDVRHALSPVVAVGRAVKVEPVKATRARRVKLAEIATAEQGGWTFTAHALTRLGERKLDALDVIRTAQNPAHTYPSESLPEATVHERDGLKVVVVAERKTIITAVRRADVDDATRAALAAAS